MGAIRKNQLVVVRHSPYGSSLGRAAIDVALAAAAFDQPVSVLFMGDGVLQLLPDQDSAAIDRKSIAKYIASLPLYDIELIHVDAHALSGFAIDAHDLPQSTTLLDDDAIHALMADHHHILGF